MKTKTILIGLAVIIIVVAVAFFLIEEKKVSAPTPGTETTETTQEQPTTSAPTGTGKLKVANFTGTLEKVDTGCFADGECYVVVDGKHITTTRGWSQDTVGTVQGVDSFGDLESHIGGKVEVYAKDNADGTYTLYGSEGFYIKLVQ